MENHTFQGFRSTSRILAFLTEGYLKKVMIRSHYCPLNVEEVSQIILVTQRDFKNLKHFVDNALKFHVALNYIVKKLDQ